MAPSWTAGTVGCNCVRRRGSAAKRRRWGALTAADGGSIEAVDGRGWGGAVRAVRGALTAR